MGSSSKKHKKESKKRKHKSRSRSPSDLRDTLNKRDRDSSSARKHHKHREREPDNEGESSSPARSRSPATLRREHKHRHKKHKEKEHKHRESEEIVNLDNDDSDSSDCVEVPLAPPAPVISKDVDKEREKERERERERERAREREREKEARDRQYEREREREAREREYEREKERAAREKEYERQREREAHEREYEREREREVRERERDREREARERDHDRERQRERERRREHEMRERARSRSRSASPIPENGAGDSLSIEETNKLRAKLGLKPLEVDSSAATSSASKGSKDGKNAEGLSSYKDEWGEFLHKPAKNLSETAEATKIREKLQQRKEKRKLEEKLKMLRTLGESDDEVDDLTKWVDRSKQKDELRKEAAKRAKALEEMDEELTETEKVRSKPKHRAYKDNDLKGLRVDHDMEEFAEGRTVILTLKDQGVLDEDDDTLVNVNMIDDERYKKNVENKKQNPLNYGYNVYEENYDEFGNPIEREILGKYDDEIGAPKKKNFLIGENLEEEREHRRRLLEIKTKLAGRKLETLADMHTQLASDTYSEAEIATFKKPKRKIKKLRQKLKADDLLVLGEGGSSSNDFGSRRRHMDDDEEMKPDLSGVKIDPEEEEDLERVLSKARKLKQKESIIRRGLDIDPDLIKAEIKDEPAGDADALDTAARDGFITLNATAEFCRTLGDIPTYGMAGNRDEGSNDMMDFESLGEPSEYETKYEAPEASTGTWNSVNPDEVIRPMDEDHSNEPFDVAILDEEPDVGSGVGNALKLALSKGYLEKEDSNRPSNTTMAHLQAKNYSIEDKSYTEDDKFNRRDRYQSGPIMDFKDKSGFNPNVKLEYIDDSGRILNAKEAFRYLSHKFHGKGPGKNKIEKRLKKVEQEGLMKTMSSTDTPLGTLTMLQQKQKETKTAYVVLSGGKQNVGSTSISKHK